MLFQMFYLSKGKEVVDSHEISYTERAIKEENPTYEELEQWYRESGLPLKRFFNTGGLIYKSMNLKDRLPTMSEEELLRLLAADGMLVKRPLAVWKEEGSEKVHVLTGFKEAEWEAALEQV